MSKLNFIVWLFFIKIILFTYCQQESCKQAWVGPGTGAWYRVDSNCSTSNYYQTTALIQLPQVIIRNISSGDGVYSSLGVYETTNGNGADIGLTFQDNYWYSYAASEKKGWMSGSIKIPSFEAPLLYISATIVEINTICFRVTDFEKKNEIGKDFFIFEDEMKLNPLGLNIGFYRFDSIAQSHETLKSGSSLSNSIVKEWKYYSNVDTLRTEVLATKEFVAIQNRGYPAGKCCSEQEKKTIALHSEMEFYGSDLSIKY